MDARYRVLVNAPKPKNLSPEQARFLQDTKQKLESAGLRITEIDEALRLEEQAVRVQALDGVVAVAFGQWQGQRLLKKKDEAVFPTEFNHLNIALAAAARRPLLVLKEKSVSERGALRPSLGCRTIKLPSRLEPSWLDTDEFKKPFELWLGGVRSHSHVFLGYCSKAGGTAAQVQLRVEKLGVKVHNWAMDFAAGASILARIEEARNACSLGMFLFTEDDPLEGLPGEAAPRDNVVFEAGYFMSAKGPGKCLIIREGAAKMPADLGGTIYVQLRRGDDVSTIESRLTQFVTGSL